MMLPNGTVHMPIGTASKKNKTASLKRLVRSGAE
jgi:hypothetical protein